MKVSSRTRGGQRSGALPEGTIDGALARALGAAGLTARPVVDPRDLPAAASEARSWELAGGERLLLESGGLRLRAPGGRSRPILLPGRPDLEGLCPSVDGRQLLISTDQRLLSMPLPPGPPQVRWSTGLGEVACITGERAVALSFEDLLLLEARGPQLVPVATLHGIKGRQLMPLLGGRLVLCYPGRGEGGECTLIGAYPESVERLGQLRVAVQAVVERAGRPLVRIGDEAWFELRGLEERWRKGQPARPGAPLPRSKIFKRLAADPRAAALPILTEVERFESAVQLLRSGGRTFAVIPRGRGYELAWEREGQRRSARLPKLERGQSWEDGQLQVVVSPQGRHALVYRCDGSTLLEVDLATGGDDLPRQDDPASGSIHSAGYLDEDVYAWAHWQCHVHRRGSEEALIEMEPRYSSVAGAPGPGGRHFFAGVQAADADGDQHLQVLEIEGLGSEEPHWLWHPVYPLGRRLATLERHQDQILLSVADQLFRLALPSLL